MTSLSPLSSGGPAEQSERSRLVLRRLGELTLLTGYNIEEIDYLLQKFKMLANPATFKMERDGFFRYMQKFAFEKSILKRLFLSFDSDLDGSLSFDEWVIHLSVLERGTKQDMMLYLFRLFDAGHRGFLSLEELLELCSSIRSGGAAAATAGGSANAIASASSRVRLPRSATALLQPSTTERRPAAAAGSGLRLPSLGSPPFITAIASSPSTAAAGSGSDRFRFREDRASSSKGSAASAAPSAAKTFSKDRFIRDLRRIVSRIGDLLDHEPITISFDEFLMLSNEHPLLMRIFDSFRDSSLDQVYRI